MQVTRLANGIRGRIAILGRCYMVADMNEPTCKWFQEDDDWSHYDTE